MAEEIVACPGCGKKFRIPEGAGAGSFDCTACGADVAYGKPAAAVKPARGAAGGAGKRRRASRGARRGATRKGRRGGRRGAPAEDDEEGGGKRGARPKKEDHTVPIIAGIMGGVVLILGLVYAFTRDTKESDDTQGTAGGNVAAGTITADSGTADVTPDDGGTDTPEDGGDAGTPDGDDTGPESVDGGDTPADDSGIGATAGGPYRTKDYRYWFLRAAEEVFTECEPLEGMAAAEVEELRSLAALFADVDSGAPGMSAGHALGKKGKKAFPFLLNELVNQYNAKRWTDLNERISSWQIQQKLREIIKATEFPSSFNARFVPGADEVQPTEYERAARMWIAWWRGEGKHIEKFTPFPDEEE